MDKETAYSVYNKKVHEVVVNFLGDPYWIRTSDLLPVKEAL